jgi:hypothetical protein
MDTDKDEKDKPKEPPPPTDERGTTFKDGWSKRPK